MLKDVRKLQVVEGLKELCFSFFFIETSVWHNVYTNCLCSWVKKSKHQGGIKIFGSHLLCGSYSDLFSFSPGSVCLVVYGWEKALYDRRSQCNHVRTRSFSPTERTREERPNGRKIRPPINLSSSYSSRYATSVGVVVAVAAVRDPCL
jgi:hypothetical protein